jgi:hypothetical protein
MQVSGDTGSQEKVWLGWVRWAPRRVKSKLILPYSKGGKIKTKQNFNFLLGQVQHNIRKNLQIITTSQNGMGFLEKKKTSCS